jgi:hypothetical protein
VHIPAFRTKLQRNRPERAGSAGKLFYSLDMNKLGRATLQPPKGSEEERGTKTYGTNREADEGVRGMHFQA